MKSYPAILSLRDAAVLYRSDLSERLVWSNLNLDIHAGEWVAVAGANGSGKSTLASVLLGIRELSRGSLIRSDTCIVRGVLQSPDSQFVGETIEDELADAIGEQAMNKVAFRRFGAETLASVGLSLPLERQLSSLSGGQKQLVNLAAALASKPDVLVLDEPSAMLDPDTTKRVLAAIRAAHGRGMTVIWVTHRLEEACRADRIIVFANGAIGFDGTPRAFFYGKEDAARVATGAPADVPCRALNMELPYVVHVATGLLKRGYRLKPLPLHAEELAEAVSMPCR